MKHKPCAFVTQERERYESSLFAQLMNIVDSGPSKANCDLSRPRHCRLQNALSESGQSLGEGEKDEIKSKAKRTTKVKSEGE